MELCIVHQIEYRPRTGGRWWQAEKMFKFMLLFLVDSTQYCEAATFPLQCSVISNHSIGQKGEYILIVNTKMLIECCLVSMYGNFYVALISGECLK